MNRSYSVSEINRYISGMFQMDYALSRITVKGELSNVKYYPSGHIYFTLKDQASQLSCVMFAGDRAGLAFAMENGQKVQVSGRISVYERNGTYQLYAKSVQPEGIGDLYLRMEQTRKELLELGVFDAMYKKPIPGYIRKLGIVTAKTGAAVRDIIEVAKRRNPYIDITLYPAVVQGDQAKASIVQGIECLDQMGMDIIIVGRGGGSFEDLFAFNEPEVVMAIFHADTPIISAVGHEIDNSLSDLAADLRAPTPSAAAELAVKPLTAILEEIRGYHDAFCHEMERSLREAENQLQLRTLSFEKHSPRSVLMQEKQRLMYLEESFRSRILQLCREKRSGLQNYLRFRQLLEAQIERKRNRVPSQKLLRSLFTQKLQRDEARLRFYAEKLDLSSPLKKLSGGFAYVTEGEHRVGSIKEVKVGHELELRFRDGSAKTRVVQKKEEEMISGNG